MHSANPCMSTPPALLPSSFFPFSLICQCRTNFGHYKPSWQSTRAPHAVVKNDRPDFRGAPRDSEFGKGYNWLLKFPPIAQRLQRPAWFSGASPAFTTRKAALWIYGTFLISFSSLPFVLPMIIKIKKFFNRSFTDAESSAKHRGHAASAVWSL